MQNPFPQEDVSHYFDYNPLELSDAFIDKPGRISFRSLGLYKNVTQYDISVNFF